MAEAKEVKGINLDNLNKLVVVDRAYDDDVRNGLLSTKYKYKRNGG